jgi:hypothetical protein
MQLDQDATAHGGLLDQAIFLHILIGCDRYAPCGLGRFTIRPPGSDLTPNGAEAQLQHFPKGSKNIAIPDVSVDVTEGTIDVTAYTTEHLTYDGRNGGGRFAGHFDFTFADGTKLTADFDTPFCRYICP